MRYGKWFGAQGRIQTFNLWFVGPALSQLSYSGGNSVSRFAFRAQSVTKLETGNPKLETCLVEPLTGLEPGLINVRSVVPFPLGYRGKLERQAGFEPAISTLARLRDTGLRYCRMAQGAGIEPAMFCLTGRRQQPALVP